MEWSLTLFCQMSKQLFGLVVSITIKKEFLSVS